MHNMLTVTSMHVKALYLGALYTDTFDKLCKNSGVGLYGRPAITCCHVYSNVQHSGGCNDKQEDRALQTRAVVASSFEMLFTV